LEWIATTPAGPAAVQVPRGKLGGLGWLMAAVVAAAGATLGLVHWREKPEPGPLVRFTIPPPQG